MSEFALAKLCKHVDPRVKGDQRPLSLSRRLALPAFLPSPTSLNLFSSQSERTNQKVTPGSSAQISHSPLNCQSSAPPPSRKRWGDPRVGVKECSGSGGVGTEVGEEDWPALLARQRKGCAGLSDCLDVLELRLRPVALWSSNPPPSSEKKAEIRAFCFCL